MENNTTWKRIYDLAAEVYKLSPWSFLNEDDVFGILSPVTGKEYFISITGAEGVLQALTAYEGSEALDRFWMLDNSETADGSEIFSISHTILSFETEKEINAGQLKRFQEASAHPAFVSQFPEIHRIVPGFYNSEPADDILDEIIIILEQSVDMLQRLAGDQSLLETEEEDVFLFRQWEDGKWTDKTRHVKSSVPDYPITWNGEDIDQINKLPMTQAVLQAHGQLLPFPVEKDGERKYFPYLVLLLNKRSWQAEGREMLYADPDFKTMFGKVPKIYLDFIKQMGFRPRSIEFMSPALFEILTPPLEQCGIKPVLFKKLPMVTNYVEAFITKLQKRG